jgi:invasion protein IalB
MKTTRILSNFILCMLPLYSCLCLAQIVQPDENPLEDGQIYIAETFEDWQKLCIRQSGEKDPCHIYQLIRSKNDHPTAEIILFRIEDEEGVSAAGTILAPHKTLLTSNLVLTVEKDNPWDYPFSWCDKRGCYVRIALTDDDVLSMKKRRSGSIGIVSVTAPDQPISLPLSFLGFTAAFGSLQN